MDTAALSYEQIVALLEHAGRVTSSKYIEQIVSGFRRPSYDFAKDLSRLTKGSISVEQFMDFQRGRAA